MTIREEWTGDAVKKMHIYGISQHELAEEADVSREMVNKILNGKAQTKKSKERIESALERIVAKRTA